MLDTGKFSAIPEDTGRESVAKKTNDNISSRDKLDTSAFFDDSDDDRDIVAKNKASGSKGASSSSIGKTDRKKQPMSSNIDFALSDDDELDDAKKSSVASLSSPPPKARSTFIDDEAADEDDIGQSQEKNADIKDDNSLDSLLPTAPNHGDSDDDSAEGDFDFDAMRHPFPPAAFAAPLPERQAVFAPSSSPLDLSRRFLCWNHVGAATLRRGDDRSTVDINFTDYGVRRPITFTDNLGFILGSLGEDGGIFATDLVEDDASNDDPLVNAASGFSEKTREAIKNQLKKQDPNKPLGSTIYFHRFETFGALRDKDWYLTLPSGERALGCATGDGWAAVLTRYVGTCQVFVATHAWTSNAWTSLLYLLPAVDFSASFRLEETRGRSSGWMVTLSRWLAALAFWQFSITYMNRSVMERKKLDTS